MCQIILGCDGSRFENTELLRPKPLQLSILHCMSRTLYVVSAFYFQGTWRSIDVCCNERGVRVWKEGLCRDLPLRALSSLLPRDACLAQCFRRLSCVFSFGAIKIRRPDTNKNSKNKNNAPIVRVPSPTHGRCEWDYQSMGAADMDYNRAWAIQLRQPGGQLPYQ